MIQEALKTVLVMESAEELLHQIQQVLSLLRAGDCLYAKTIQEVQLMMQLPQFSPTFVISYLRLGKESSAPLIEALMQKTEKLMPILMTVHKVTENEIKILGEMQGCHFIVEPFSQETLQHKIVETIAQWNDQHTDLGFQKRYQELLDSKQYAIAQKETLDKAQQNPNSASYRVMLARIAFLTGQEKEAEALCLQILKILPSYLQALSLMSKIKIKQNKLEEALSYLSKAHKESPLNIKHIISQGEIYLAQNESSLAEIQFKKALKISSSCDDAKIGLARSLADQNKEEECLDILKTLQDPYELPSFFNLKAILLSRTGKYEESIKMYEIAQKYTFNPEKKESLQYNMALSYLKNGNLQKAYALIKACGITQNTHRVKHFIKIIEYIKENPEKINDLLAKIQQSTLTEEKISHEDQDFLTSTEMGSINKEVPLKEEVQEGPHENVLVYTKSKRNYRTF